MNTVIIVLPILTLLMFELGLTLTVQDFTLLLRRPKPLAVALLGQIVLLPLIAFALAEAFALPPVFYIGMVLIACCPGGSSSNVFSMLAKGDVALSVSLTALNSIITLFTLPFIMSLATSMVGMAQAEPIHLPVGNLLMQNLVLMFLPILAGLCVKRRWPKAAGAIDRVLAKLAFPALMLLAGVFFVQHREEIAANIATLGMCITALLMAATAMAGLLSHSARLTTSERRTIVIEVGMQNAAQAIAIASSPFVFNDSVMAIPAIIYALMMNLVLIVYVLIVRNR